MRLSHPNRMLPLNIPPDPQKLNHGMDPLISRERMAVLINTAGTHLQ
jgi:hypothetical protein